jgi:hypothetical protein
VGFLPLRDNSFKTELAGVPKHGLAVALHVLVESNAWPSLGQDYSKRGLATLQRIRSEIVTVQFDQVEGVQENAFVMVPVANAIEQRDAVVITGNRLPVDDADTMGIFVVAALATWAAKLPAGVAITATRPRTRSVMSAGSRSNWPSSQWYSTVTFWPST